MRRIANSATYKGEEVSEARYEGKLKAMEMDVLRRSHSATRTDSEETI